MDQENNQPIQEEAVVHRPTRSLKKQIIVPLSIFLFLLTMTAGIILYAKGYRFFLQQGEPRVSKTGLLRVTSLPPGAQVYVDGHLTTATDNTISLPPKKYTIKIAKDGYWDWQKDFEIKQEVVLNANALLFPKAPTLKSISTFGINSIVVDPSGTKLALKIASDSAKRNGIYVLDMTSRTFPVLAGQSNSTQLADDTIDAFSQSSLTWSPDGKQLLASISGKLKQPTYYLLKTDGFNKAPEDTTATLQALTDTWELQKHDKEIAQLKSFKANVQKFAAQNFHILAWSPDEEKILYQALQTSDMPVFLNPRLIGNNNLYERRDLEKGAVYVYNIKEDLNTRIVESAEGVCVMPSPECLRLFTWLPDSEHLIYLHDKKVDIVENDGSNMTTIYAGPFLDHYAFPWADGSKIVILTNLNSPDVSPTLYTIGLK